MHLSLGDLHVESSDYESAIQSFERARTQMRHHRSRPLLVVSLVRFLTALSQLDEIAHCLDRYLDGFLMTLAS